MASVHGRRSKQRQTKDETMTSFASLMALSATQTKQAQQVVESQLAERKRKEAAQKKLQEEKEAKEREQEKRMRLKKLQEDQRQQERLQKLEAERKAREAAQQKREDEQRDALRYGPKKAKANAAGAKQAPSSADGARRRRDGNDSDEGPSGTVLTREEIRQRKQQAEQRKLFQGARRTAPTAVRSYGKVGTRLPGGAVNIVTNQGGVGVSDFQVPLTGGSVKDRITAAQNTLVMLNTNKRDKRTEDEIQMQVRAKRQVLEGHEAAQFDDWFGEKKRELNRLQKSPSKTPAVATPSPPSRAITPAARPTASGAISTSVSASTSQKPDPRQQKSSLSKSATTTAQKAMSRSASSDVRPSTSKYPKMNKASSSSSAPPPPPRVPRPAAYPPAGPGRTKRPRSPSFSDSESPPRRTKKRASAGGAGEDIREDIWKLFGRRRDDYVKQDVYSDDEDMEADAYSLANEEAKSARIARLEDQRAQEEERRHEEEKRRRKKERDRAAARGH